MNNALVIKPFGTDFADWTSPAAIGGIIVAGDVLVAAAGGAGVRNFVTAIQYINTAVVASEMVIKGGAVVLWRVFVPASMTAPVTITFPTPLRTGAATAVNIEMAVTATATYVNIQGYRSE